MIAENMVDDRSMQRKMLVVRVSALLLATCSRYVPDLTLFVTVRCI